MDKMSDSSEILREYGVKILEDQYKDEMIRMLEALYPAQGFTSKCFFQRIAVTDFFNPHTKTKEYGVVFYCNKTIISIVEAFDGLDESVLSFALEGLATGIYLCDQIKRNFEAFDYQKLKVIVFEKIPTYLKNDTVYVDPYIIRDESIVFQPPEFEAFERVFSEVLKLPVTVFSSRTNSEATQAFLKAKEILRKIPNTRVPRDLV